VAYAADLGVRPVLSTNGTLITPGKARELRDAGLQYAGISVDGMPERNDRFRGQEGAFDAAVRGIEACRAVGLKTGLRYTITERNVDDLEDIVALLHDVGVDRFCFYHLDYGGRGADIVDVDLDPSAKRLAVKRLCDLTREYHDEGHEIETLLVGNYADAAYLVEYAAEHLGAETAERIYRYLRRNGGDPAGERVANVDYQGNVHPTQFWQGYSLGNVGERPFSVIWEDETDQLLHRLRSREEHLQGRCSRCQYQEICRGGSRLRALTVHDDIDAPDPQCYLTEKEITSPPIEVASTEP
jgi:pseudo-rSAM protein/SPASM domain protein